MDDLDLANVTYSSLNAAINQIITARDGELAGIPMPLPGLRLVLESKHPWAPRLDELQTIVDGGCESSPLLPDIDDVSVDDSIVNSWYSHAKRGTVYVLRNQATQRVSWVLEPDATVRNRFLLGPLETAPAWPLRAEFKAMKLLRRLVTPHAFRTYILTGQFIETSKRSGVSYVFRRLRPTLAISTALDYFTGESGARIIAALCLHPIGMYQSTFCGGQVPTDDVVAHLTMMRADEHMLWRRANQHPSYSVLAGI